MRRGRAFVGRNTSVGTWRVLVDGLGEGSTGGGANRGGIEGCGTHDQGGTRSNSSWSGGAQCFPHFAVLHMLQKTIRSKGPMAR